MRFYELTHSIEWLYFPTENLRAADPHDFVLVSQDLFGNERKKSERYRFAVRCDGSTEWIRDSDFQRQLASQRTK